jgi:hypothetical protein
LLRRDLKPTLISLPQDRSRWLEVLSHLLGKAFGVPDTR